MGGISISLPIDLQVKLEAVCSEYSLPKSYIMRQALIEYLKNLEDK
jgi:predicted DNA-binding protein